MKPASWSRLSWVGGLLLGAVALNHGQQAQPTPARPLTWEFLISKNYLPYHQLKPEDFPIDDHTHPKFGFFVKCFVQPSFHFVTGQSPGGYFYIHITDWTIFSGLNKNESFRRSNLPDVKAALPVAQAILDLNEIYARQLAAMLPGDLPVGDGPTYEKAYAQLAGRVTGLVQATLANAEKEEEAFSDATSGGRDQRKARALGAAIKKRLTAISAATPTPAVPAIPPVPSVSATASPSPTTSPR